MRDAGYGMRDAGCGMRDADAGDIFASTQPFAAQSATIHHDNATIAGSPPSRAALLTQFTTASPSCYKLVQDVCSSTLRTKDMPQRPYFASGRIARPTTSLSK
jgi:hypothetical protein